mgnify:FL=1
MLVFYINGKEVKNFMHKILIENCFDDFDVRNVEIQSFAKFNIDGKANKSFLEAEGVDPNTLEDVYFSKWGRIRPYIFEFIKGKIKPSYMKFIISANNELLTQISDNASALFLNFVFENDKVVCTTGTSQKTFALNKELDIAWEEYVRNFFKNIGVAIYEEK